MLLSKKITAFVAVIFLSIMVQPNCEHRRTDRYYCSIYDPGQLLIKPWMRCCCRCYFWKKQATKPNGKPGDNIFHIEKAFLVKDCGFIHTSITYLSQS